MISCSSSLHRLRQHLLISSTGVVRILTTWARCPLCPQGPGVVSSVVVGGCADLEGGMFWQEKWGRTVCDCFKITFSSQLGIKGGWGIHQLVLLEFPLLEMHAIKWLAHKWEISYPKRFGFRAFVLAVGQNQQQVPYTFLSQAGGMGTVRSGRGQPFLITLKDPLLLPSS